MHDDIIELVYGLLLGNCGYQTDRKIYDQSEIALNLRSSRDKIRFTFQYGLRPSITFTNWPKIKLAYVAI